MFCFEVKWDANIKLNLKILKLKMAKGLFKGEINIESNMGVNRGIGVLREYIAYLFGLIEGNMFEIGT